MTVGQLRLVAVGDVHRSMLQDVRPIFGGVDVLLGRPQRSLDLERPGVVLPSVSIKNGVRYATLSFTDHLNVDLARRAGRLWSRPLDLEPAMQAVRDARKHADVVVVSVAWGTEHQTKPTPRQRRIAARLATAGADLIVGHLPDVMQPIEVLKSGTRRTVVAYSLGSLASDQVRHYQPEVHGALRGDPRDGAALKVSFAKVKTPKGNGATVIEDIAYEPLWTQETPAATRRLKIVPVVKAADMALVRLDALAQAEAALRSLLETQEEYRALAARRERIVRILGETQELNRQLKGAK